MMRFHSQTAGVTLTAQQPMNNVVRVAYQALAAVLGGTQSLHTNSMDETLALPTEQAVQVALRTQQILAYETGVPNVIDPLGGSYYVEALTDQLERRGRGDVRRDRARGRRGAGHRDGLVPAPDRRVGRRHQWEIEEHRRVVVGVNEFVVDEPEVPIPLLKIGEEAAATQAERLERLRRTRDGALVRRRLDALAEAAQRKENLIPAMLDAARAYATLYEIREALENVYGSYREPIFF